MKTRKPIYLSIILLQFAMTPASEAATYASSQAQEVIEQMVDAHGGYENWVNAPSFKFTALMYLAVLKLGDDRTAFDNWRYYN